MLFSVQFYRKILIWFQSLLILNWIQEVERDLVSGFDSFFTLTPEFTTGSRIISQSSYCFSDWSRLVIRDFKEVLKLFFSFFFFL